MASPRKIKLGELLVRAGVIDELQLNSALAHQKQWGGRLGRHITQLGFSDARTISRALAKQLGLPYMDMRAESVDLKLLEKFPEQYAIENCCLPFKLGDRTVGIVMADPTNIILADDIQARFGKRVEVYVAAEHAIGELIERAYRAREYGKESLPAGSVDESVARSQTTEAASARAAEEVEETPTAPADEGNGSWEELQTKLEEYASNEAPSSKRAAPALKAVPPPPPAPVPAPVAPRPAAAGATAPAPEGELPSVFIFDPDPQESSLLRSTLRASAFSVFEAQKLAQIPEQMKSVVPSVLVLEVSPENMSATELASKLKGSSRFADVRIILLAKDFSGWRAREDLKEIAQADTVIEKPVTLAKFRAAAGKLLEDLHGSGGTDQVARAEAQRLLAEGRNYAEQGDVESAVSRFADAVEFDPGLAEAHQALASAYEHQQKYHLAIAAYEKAAELDPKNFLVFKSLSLLYEKQGFKRKAYEAFERSARTCPNPQMKAKILAHMAKLLER